MSEQRWREVMPKAVIPSTWCIGNSTVEVQYGVSTNAGSFHGGGITLTIFYHPKDEPEIKQQLSIQLKDGDAHILAGALLGLTRMGIAELEKGLDGLKEVEDEALTG